MDEDETAMSDADLDAAVTVNTDADTPPTVNGDSDTPPTVNTDVDTPPTVNTDVDTPPTVNTDVDTSPTVNVVNGATPLVHENVDEVNAEQAFIVNTETKPAPVINADPAPTVNSGLDTTLIVDIPAVTADEEAHRPDVKDEGEFAPDAETEVILEPPEDYQSPDEEGHEEKLPPPPPITMTEETVKEPVEHDVTRAQEKVENTEESASTVEDKPATDEPDSRMKASEIKPSDVAINIEMSRQCGDCHSTKCTCNVALLVNIFLILIPKS